MSWANKIKYFLEAKSKLLFALALILFLCACNEPPEEEDCATIQDGLSECPFCDFFKIITKSATKLATGAWDKLAKGLSSVVLVVAAIYVALFTLRMVASYGKQTVADYLTSEKSGLFKLMFKATIIYELLNSNLFQTSVLFPLLGAGLDIGTVLAQTTGGEFGKGASEWGEMFQLVLQAVRKFNESTQFIISLGEAFCCHATLDAIWHWDFLELIYGIILFCFGWLLTASISFFLVDVIIRLTLGAVLLAPGIALAISSLTSAHARKIWNLYINVFFSFVIVGVFLGMTQQLITFSLEIGHTPLMGWIPATNTQGMVDANNVASLFDALTNFGQLILGLVCMCLLMNLSMSLGKLADDLADTEGLAGSDGKGRPAAGSPMQTVAAAPARLASKQLNKAGNYVTDKAVNTTKYAGHVISRVTRFDKLAKKTTSARGYLTGTGREGYKAFWRK